MFLVLSRSNRLWGFFNKKQKRGTKSDTKSLFFYWLKRRKNNADRKNENFRFNGI
nr:MAG TPA: hypothetical protein [Caudoviricetes sp.]